MEDRQRDNCFSIYVGGALSGDLLGVNRSMEREVFLYRTVLFQVSFERVLYITIIELL